MPTKQETFDRVVKHLLEQGGPARDSSGYYFYRDVSGRSCAAGCLIPDGKYTDAMDARGAIYEAFNFHTDFALIYARIDASSLDTNHPALIVLEEEGHDPVLVAQLQNIHDDYWNECEERLPFDHLRHLADLHALSPAVLLTQTVSQSL